MEYVTFFFFPYPLSLFFLPLSLPMYVCLSPLLFHSLSVATFTFLSQWAHKGLAKQLLNHGYAAAAAYTCNPQVAIISGIIQKLSLILGLSQTSYDHSYDNLYIITPGCMFLKKI